MISFFRTRASVGILPTQLRTRFFCDGCPETKRKGLVLGVHQGEDNEPLLTDAAKEFNEKCGGKLSDVIMTSCVEWAKGEGRVFHNLDEEYLAVSVVGLGPPNQGYNKQEAVHDGMEAARIAAAVGTRLLMEESEDEFGAVGDINVEDMKFAEGAAEGAVLSMWRYQEFKDKRNWQLIPSLTLYHSTDTDSFQRGIFKAEAQNLVRKWSDTPANYMTPQHFGQEVVNLLCPCGLRVEVHDAEWILNAKLNGLLAVARGSCEPHVVLTVTYCGAPDHQKPIVLLGKGVTYDSGGVCLKECEYLPGARADISGVATVIATMYTAAALSLPVNIKSIVCVCENMISGMAMKCGDIVLNPLGQSVCIEDTDNEGLVLMSDMLAYSCVNFRPRVIIDVGAFSKDVIPTFGSAATAVYTNSQTMWTLTRKAGVITGDRVWRMPLWKTFREKVIERPSHDINVVGRGPGSHNMAAAFLQECIRSVDWIHFDTANVSREAVDKLYPYYQKGFMTGRPTRTIIQLLYQLACPEEGAREIS